MNRKREPFEYHYSVPSPACEFPGRNIQRFLTVDSHGLLASARQNDRNLFLDPNTNNNLDHPVFSPGESRAQKPVRWNLSKRQKPDSLFRRTNPSDRESGSRPQSDLCSGRSFTPSTRQLPYSLLAYLSKSYGRQRLSKIRQPLQSPQA